MYTFYDQQNHEEDIYQGFGEILALANGKHVLCLLYVEHKQIYLQIDTVRFVIDEEVDIRVDSTLLRYTLTLSKGNDIFYIQSFRKGIGEAILSTIDATYDEFDRERHFIYFLGTHLGDQDWRSFFIEEYGKTGR
jgi:hypothetical protein